MPNYPHAPDVTPPFTYGTNKCDQKPQLPNKLAIPLSIVIPWIIFVATDAMFSFRLQFDLKCLLCILCAVILVMILFIFKKGIEVHRRLEEGDTSQKPHWWFFVASTGLFAFSMGCCIGDINYEINAWPYYAINHGTSYPNVNPDVVSGSQVVDATSIVFESGSHLNNLLAMSFMGRDIHCVVPIVKTNSTRLDSYDFWAVGTNCCPSKRPDFHCGEYKNPDARSGIVVLDAMERAFLNLAVQQAKGVYKIESKHPIFVHWMQDPVTVTNAYQEEAFSFWLLTAIASGGVQMMFVGAYIIYLRNFKVT